MKVWRDTPKLGHVQESKYPTKVDKVSLLGCIFKVSRIMQITYRNMRRYSNKGKKEFTDLASLIP